MHYNQWKWLIDRRVSYVYIYILQYISTEISNSNQYEYYSLCWNGDSSGSTSYSCTSIESRAWGGEYTFIFHWRLSEDSSGGADNSTDQGCVYFGRDSLGRRYLLVTSRTNTNTIMNDCITNLDTGNLSSIPIPCNKRQQIPVGKGNQASIEILFSGRVDSIILAALYHDHVPLDQPIDLINVELQLSIPHWNCLSIEWFKIGLRGSVFTFSGSAGCFIVLSRNAISLAGS